MKSIDPGEVQLFSEAMADVAPLDAKAKQSLRKSEALSPEAKQRQRDAALGVNNNRDDENFLSQGEVPSVHPLEFVEWKQDGVQNAVFSKLRRAGYVVEFELDLHHKTVKEARTLVFNLLAKATAKSWRCVLISHGKGEQSATPGRLKSYVTHWLKRHPQIIAYCSAQRFHGGVGSVYVLIKKSPASKALNKEQFS